MQGNQPYNRQNSEAQLDTFRAERPQQAEPARLPPPAHLRQVLIREALSSRQYSPFTILCFYTLEAILPSRLYSDNTDTIDQTWNDCRKLLALGSQLGLLAIGVANQSLPLEVQLQLIAGTELLYKGLTDRSLLGSAAANAAELVPTAITHIVSTVGEMADVIAHTLRAD